MAQNWLITRQEHTLYLTLNRPHALNVLTVETLHELRDIAVQIQHDRQARVIVLQAEGPHFSAGVDVKAIAAMQGQSLPEFDQQLADLQGCINAFEALPQPIVARLRGHVIGGGMILAACCDFRVADTTTRFSLPEVRLGIPVIMGTHRLTRLAGAAITKEMILLAEPFDAATAYRWNLVHRVVEPDELDAAVGTIVQRLLSLPPLTLQSAKRIIDQGHALSSEAAQALERAEQAKLLATHDFAEATDAYFSKRAPSFTGS